jgi:class 3 adenylate cyclase
MSDAHPHAAAIAALEAQRSVLGDTVVDGAVAALRAAPSPTPVAHSPRLRQASILFVDVVDSTALLQHLQPDEALTIVSQALEQFAASVRAEGGEVLRFTGDGLKGAFGTRSGQEDHAEAAVRAGLAIVQAAATHAERLRTSLGPQEFGVRVGVHTGPVVLGGGVEADRTAMGHAVNLAARLEQAAPVGRLRISHETWAQVRGLFRVEPQPPLVIKGHDEPLVTYLVDAALPDPERAPRRGLEQVSSPLIGRGAELTALRDRLAAGAAVPPVAWVIAEAGVGKSRLRRELAAALGGEQWQARAHPAGALQPFGLLRQMVMRGIGLPDSLPAEAARARLVEALAPRLGPDGATQAMRLGHLLGLDFGSQLAVQALRARELRVAGTEALATLLAPAALVVLDDLQWADDESLALVRELAEGGRVRLLLLARPPLADREPALVAPPALVLRLQPLAADDGCRLADALLAPLQAPTPALHALLVGRAAGNPFFMEELVRMLIDDGVIDAHARPWQLDEGRLRASRVPGTLVGVLQARLDALPAGELSALQQASVVGPVFWDAALAALDPAAPDALPDLLRRELVVAREVSAFDDTAERAFQHALLHDVTYGTVLTATRRESHARAARWLADRMGDRATEFLALAADHFERAGDSAMALEYYDRARADAVDRFAQQAALALIERALAQPALTDRRHRFVLLAQRVIALEFLDWPGELVAATEAQDDYAEACDDDAMRAEVVVGRMLRADHEGRPDEARTLGEQALALAARCPTAHAAPSATLAHGELAWLALERQDFQTVRQQLDLAFDQARRAAEVPSREGGYRGYELQLRLIEIEACQRQERPLDALHSAESALHALAALDRPYLHDRVNLMLQRGAAWRQLGDLALARTETEAALALAESMQAPRLIAITLLNAADAALDAGALEAAEGFADRLAEAAAASIQAYQRPAVPRLRAELAEARGQAAVAATAWDDASAQYEAQSRAPEALQARARAAAQRHAQGHDVREEVRRVLAQALSDDRPHWMALQPLALRACHAVLAATGEPEAAGLAAALQARLAEQLAQFPADDPRREQLRQQARSWRGLCAPA